MVLTSIDTREFKSSAMDEQRFSDLLNKYLQGTCTAEEVRLLNRFYDSFQEEKSQTDEADAFDMWIRGEKIRRDISYQISQKERAEYAAQQKKKSRVRTAWKIAASVLLIVGIGWGSYYLYLDIPAPEVAWMERSTRKGQKATVSLTDGTIVYLNVNSKLSFPERFGPDNREVELEGEAFFKVAKNAKRPFVIKSGGITTTVLGTSFNVKAFEGEPLHVTVTSGKVKVNAVEPGGGQNEVILLPNQQGYYDEFLLKKEVNVQQFVAWRDKVLYFEEASLAEVATVLERWFDVSITIENEQLQGCTISGKYIDESLLNILESLEHILDIEYQVQGDRQVTISGQKCTSPTQYNHDTPA